MIWAIGLACAAGILFFHYLNLARFRRQVFNQFEIVAKIARQNRVIRNLQAWLLLITRLALVGALAFFINTCARQAEKSGSSLVLLPELDPISKSGLGVVDSLIYRSGLANSSKSNIYTSDIRLKSIFTDISFLPDLHDIRSKYTAQGYGADSILIQNPAQHTVSRVSDTSFTFSSMDNQPTTLVANGKEVKEDTKTLSLNNATATEVVANGQDYFYFTKQTEVPTAFVSPSYPELKASLNPALFSLKTKQVQASVWLGVSNIEKVATPKALLYIPQNVEEAQEDLTLLGVTLKVSKQNVVPEDTFDVLDQGYFKYALTQTSAVELPVLKGKVAYILEGYTIPIIHNSKGHALVSVLPNSKGHMILFLHTQLDKTSTNLAQTEIFLPLIYSLAQKVTQTGKVTYYDLSNKQNQSALAELTATSDSIQYKQGFARSYVGNRVDRLSLPGIYNVFIHGDSSQVAINQGASKKQNPNYAYIFSEGNPTKAASKDTWLLILLATFALVEGVLLTNRLRRA